MLDNDSCHCNNTSQCHSALLWKQFEKLISITACYCNNLFFTVQFSLRSSSDSVINSNNHIFFNNNNYYYYNDNYKKLMYIEKIDTRFARLHNYCWMDFFYHCGSLLESSHATPLPETALNL